MIVVLSLWQALKLLAACFNGMMEAELIALLEPNSDKKDKEKEK